MAQYRLSGSSSRFMPGAIAVARRPREGAGPWLPVGGRKPGRAARRARTALLITTLLAAVAVAAAVLAACGDPPGGSSPSPPAATGAPAPGSRSLPGTPAEAVAAYWGMVDDDDYAGISAASVPGSAGLITAATDDLDHVELLRVTRVDRVAGGAQVEVDVRIAPSRETTPWGEAGPHTLFVDLAEAPGGGWLVAGWGTSP